MSNALTQSVGVISSAFSFRGRIGRRTWWFTQFLILIALGLAIMLADRVFTGVIADAVILTLPVPLFYWVLIATQVKRLHDRGKSAWWLLFAFVPVIGTIWFIIQTAILRGTIGANEFGADPT